MKKKLWEKLERFANEHPLAAGIKVTLNEYQTLYEAIDKEKGAPYNHVVMLSQLVDGAKDYLYWEERQEELKKNRKRK